MNSTTLALFAEDHETAAATCAALSSSLRLERLLLWMEHISLTFDVEEKLLTPKLSRLLLRSGALAAADVVSQTPWLKLKTKSLLLFW